MSQQLKQDRHQAEDQPEDQKQDQADSKQPQEDQPAPKTKNTAEWVTFAISLAIVLALVGAVTFLSFSNPNTPATFEVKLLKEEIRQAEGAYYLPLEVTNKGSKTAEDVTVRVTLSADGSEAEPEESEAAIMILAGGSTGEAVVVFKQDPAKGQLEAMVVSYLKP